MYQYPKSNIQAGHSTDLRCGQNLKQENKSKVEHFHLEKKKKKIPLSG